MVGRAGYECVALLLAGYVATRRWLNRHVGCEVSACRLRFTVSVASSTRSFTIGGHAADSGLGSHDGAPDHFAEPCTELAELRRARAAHRSVTRQHLGCLPDERLPMVFGVRRRIGAVVWVVVCVRSWYVSHRRLAMRVSDRAVWPNQALERTAAQRVFTIQMIRTLPVKAPRVLSGGRSALSR